MAQTKQLAWDTKNLDQKITFLQEIMETDVWAGHPSDKVVNRKDSFSEKYSLGRDRAVMKNFIYGWLAWEHELFTEDGSPDIEAVDKIIDEATLSDAITDVMDEQNIRGPRVSSWPNRGEEGELLEPIPEGMPLEEQFPIMRSNTNQVFNHLSMVGPEVVRGSEPRIVESATNVASRVGQGLVDTFDWIDHNIWGTMRGGLGYLRQSLPVAWGGEENPEFKRTRSQLLQTGVPGTVDPVTGITNEGFSGFHENNTFGLSVDESKQALSLMPLQYGIWQAGAQGKWGSLANVFANLGMDFVPIERVGSLFTLLSRGKNTTKTAIDALERGILLYEDLPGGGYRFQPGAMVQFNNNGTPTHAIVDKVEDALDGTGKQIGQKITVRNIGRKGQRSSTVIDSSSAKPLQEAYRHLVDVKAGQSVIIKGKAWQVVKIAERPAKKAGTSYSPIVTLQRQIKGKARPQTKKMPKNMLEAEMQGTRQAWSTGQDIAASYVRNLEKAKGGVITDTKMHELAQEIMDVHGKDGLLMKLLGVTEHEAVQRGGRAAVLPEEALAYAITISEETTKMDRMVHRWLMTGKPDDARAAYEQFALLTKLDPRRQGFIAEAARGTRLADAVHGANKTKKFMDQLEDVDDIERVLMSWSQFDTIDSKQMFLALAKQSNFNFSLIDDYFLGSLLSDIGLPAAIMAGNTAILHLAMLEKWIASAASTSLRVAKHKYQTMLTPEGELPPAFSYKGYDHHSFKMGFNAYANSFGQMHLKIPYFQSRLQKLWEWVKSGKVLSEEELANLQGLTFDPSGKPNMKNVSEFWRMASSLYGGQMGTKAGIGRNVIGMSPETRRRLLETGPLQRLVANGFDVIALMAKAPRLGIVSSDFFLQWHATQFEKAAISMQHVLEEIAQTPLPSGSRIPTTQQGKQTYAHLGHKAMIKQAHAPLFSATREATKKRPVNGRQAIDEASVRFNATYKEKLSLYQKTLASGGRTPLRVSGLNSSWGHRGEELGEVGPGTYQAQTIDQYSLNWGKNLALSDPMRGDLMEILARYSGTNIGKLASPFVSTLARLGTLNAERLFPLAMLNKRVWSELKSGGVSRDLALGKLTGGAMASLFIINLADDHVASEKEVALAHPKDVLKKIPDEEGGGWEFVSLTGSGAVQSQLGIQKMLEPGMPGFVPPNALVFRNTKTGKVKFFDGSKLSPVWDLFAFAKDIREFSEWVPEGDPTLEEGISILWNVTFELAANDHFGQQVAGLVSVMMGQEDAQTVEKASRYLSKVTEAMAPGNLGKASAVKDYERAMDMFRTYRDGFIEKNKGMWGKKIWARNYYGKKIPHPRSTFSSDNSLIQMLDFIPAWDSDYDVGDWRDNPVALEMAKQRFRPTMMAETLSKTVPLGGGKSGRGTVNIGLAGRVQAQFIFGTLRMPLSEAFSQEPPLQGEKGIDRVTGYYYNGPDWSEEKVGKPDLTYEQQLEAGISEEKISVTIEEAYKILIKSRGYSNVAGDYMPKTMFAAPRLGKKINPITGDPDTEVFDLENVTQYQGKRAKLAELERRYRRVATEIFLMLPGNEKYKKLLKQNALTHNIRQDQQAEYKRQQSQALGQAESNLGQLSQ